MRGCCECARPRYKRLVDNIYPNNPEDGLVHSNMSKLQYFALQSSPEKLDKIGQYLLQKVQRDLNRGEKGERCIFVSMDALDQLLNACHSRALNLFVTSFLAIIEILLESGTIPLKSRATKSFIQFCNIQEDSPTHQRYGFFIEIFSTLSHTDPKGYDEKPVEGRIAGLQGLQGIVKKTADEDLARFHLLDKSNLGKMLPALLMNIEKGEWEAANQEKGDVDHSEVARSAVHQRESSAGGDEKSRLMDEADNGSEATPQNLAERCFRDLLQRVKFGTTELSLIFLPMLNYLDTNGWENRRFVAKCISLVMTSIDPQYAFGAITLWLNHISERRTLPKIEIVQQLRESVNIAASQTFGTPIYEVIDKLVQYLKLSIECELKFKHECSKMGKKGQSTAKNFSGSGLIGDTHANHSSAIDENNTNVMMEQQYQEALIDVIGSIMLNVADYQKLEIIAFLFSTFPGQARQGNNSNNPPTPFRQAAAAQPSSSGSPSAAQNAAQTSSAGNTTSTSSDIASTVSSVLAETDKRMQNNLLKCIENVVQMYTTVNYSDTFKRTIIKPLIHLSLNQDPHIRMLALGIIQRLIDRHENRESFIKMDLTSDVEAHHNTTASTNHSDRNFMAVSGQNFFHTIFVNCFHETNIPESYDAIFCTLALIMVELGSDKQTLVEIIKLLLAIQEEIKSRSACKELPQKVAESGQVSFVVEQGGSARMGSQTGSQMKLLNTFVTCSFNLIGKLFAFTYKSLEEYITAVLYSMASNQRPRLEGEVAAKLNYRLSYKLACNSPVYRAIAKKHEGKIDSVDSKSSTDVCFFSETDLQKALNKEGFDARITKFVPKNRTDLLRRNSTDAVGASASVTRRGSTSSITFDIDSDKGSISSLYKGPSSDAEMIDVQTIKAILADGLSKKEKEEEQKKRQAIKEEFATLPMRVLAENIAKENREALMKRKEIFDKIDSYSKQTKCTSFPLDSVDRNVHFNNTRKSDERDAGDTRYMSTEDEIQFPVGFLI